MIIPNDTGFPWRLDKFVEYQHLAPAVDPITYCKYAGNLGLDKDQCVMLAWYHSLTYCEITAAFLLENLDYNTISSSDVKTFWADNKLNLIFGSARKYVQNMDWFYPLMRTFMVETARNPYNWLIDVAGNGSPREKYDRITKHMNSWKFMGRFSIDLFTEALISMYEAGLLGIKLEATKYDWKKTSNLTSGLLNIFYKDEFADLFDKTGKIYVSYDKLNAMLRTVMDEVKRKYPRQAVSDVSVVNKICSFRNLFKKARYGGFHHDRQLGNLYHYNKVYPEHRALWSLFLDIRREVFPQHMLGEINNRWEGIRPERKKLWVEKGLTGVESSS